MTNLWTSPQASTSPDGQLSCIEDVAAFVGEIQGGSWEAFFQLLASCTKDVADFELTALDEGALCERQTLRGQLSIVLDRSTHFASLRRWDLLQGPSPSLSDQDGPDGPDAGLTEPSGLHLELFWVPASAGKAICGYRMRGLGASSTAALAWDRVWRDFCEAQAYEPRCVMWATVPSHEKIIATWASNGRVHLDLMAIDRLTQINGELKAEVQYLIEQHKSERAITQELRAQVLELKAANRQLSMGLTLAGQGDSSGEGGQWQESHPAAALDEVWTDFAEVEDWVHAHREQIVVLPRAIGGCKKSDYESPDHLRLALEFLAGPYREARCAMMSREEMERQLEISGLKLSGSVGVSVAGNQGDAYFVSWMGRRRFLDFHLSRGGGRASRYCLRVYFFWCEASRKVVVGSMPAHLSNSLS